MPEESFYEVLGVPENATPETIAWVFKALVRIYHPDVFRGDTQFAQETLKRVNEAYETLSDPIKRAKYDQERREDENVHDIHGMGDGGEDAFEAFNSIFEHDWDTAIEFFPEAQKHKIDLARLDHSLALSYQALLLSGKQFGRAEVLFEQLQTEFLRSRFGEDKRLHDLILLAVKERRRDFARELNRALRVVGSAEVNRVLIGLYPKYSDFCSNAYKECGLSDLVAELGSLGVKPGSYRTATGKEFYVNSNFSVHLVAKSGFLVKESVRYDNVKQMIVRGAISEREVLEARRS